MAHQVVWFDVPVQDLERAMRFYTKVLATEIKKEHPGMEVGVFAHGNDDVAGCLVKAEGESPSDHGPLLYFGVKGRLDEAVRLTTELGGKIVTPKHQIGPYGYRAIVLDSEGNRIALHSE